MVKKGRIFTGAGNRLPTMIPFVKKVDNDFCKSISK
jgi:hypothetical protein